MVLGFDPLQSEPKPKKKSRRVKMDIHVLSVSILQVKQVT